MPTVLPKVEMRIRRRWWLNVYLFTLTCLCAVFNAEPNWQRVSWWLRRGMSIELWNGRRWRRIL